jgi:hypothetical protein
MMKICQNGCQNVLFDVISKVKNGSEDVSAGIGIFFAKSDA